MKRLFILLVLMHGYLNDASAQSQEAEQLLLDVQKLAQFKQILKDMESGYQVLSKGYTMIRDISKGNFTLHQVFLDGLMSVSPVVKNYKRVADIITFQIRLTDEYKTAFARFKQDKNFSADEIQYLGNVYSNLFDQSLKNVDALITVITANQLRMSDEERLAAIDRLYSDMQDKFIFLKQFNNRASILSLQRSRAGSDVNTTREIYGITP